MTRYPSCSLSERTRSWFACALGCIMAASSCSDDGAPQVVSSPRDLIRADDFSSLVFELDSVAGSELSQAVTQRVRSQVELLVDKPFGVTVVQDDVLPPALPDHAWTTEELHTLAKQSEDLKLAPGQARVHVLSLDGHSEEDNEALSILGLSWGTHTIFLFDQTLRKACAAGQLKVATVSEFCQECEALIWLHEFGHLLGLVGGIPMVEDHLDPDHAPHDKNPECLMHWLFHGGQAVDKLRGRLNKGETAPVGLDRQCLDDLRAVRDGVR